MTRTQQPVAAAAGGRAVPATVVPLTEATARTGLADSAAALRVALGASQALVAVGSGVGVDLTALTGERVRVESGVGDVTVIEVGTLV